MTSSLRTRLGSGKIPKKPRDFDDQWTMVVVHVVVVVVVVVAEPATMTANTTTTTRTKMTATTRMAVQIAGAFPKWSTSWTL